MTIFDHSPVSVRTHELSILDPTRAALTNIYVEKKTQALKIPWMKGQQAERSIWRIAQPTGPKTTL